MKHSLDVKVQFIVTPRVEIPGNLVHHVPACAQILSTIVTERSVKSVYIVCIYTCLCILSSLSVSV